jgi:hypothetical protein
LVVQTSPRDDRRALIDAKLTELGLYAKELCPEGAVEMSTVRYEDEDGHVTLVVPPTCSEQEEDRIELALAARAGDIFEATGLFIVCGVLDRPARSGASHPLS